MLGFVLKCLSWILFECNVLWSDNHNDIGLVVSLWGVNFQYQSIIYLNPFVPLSFSLMQIRELKICSRSFLSQLHCFNFISGYRTPIAVNPIGEVQKFRE
jgi:hypothetical protein